MYISNVEKVKTYKCGQIIYNYLRDKLPLLSMDNEWYYFSETDNLREILNSMPFYLKVVEKCKL